MATIQPIYAKDNGFKYLNPLSRWNRPLRDFRTFSNGVVGDNCQNNNSGLDDGWDGYAGGSFYDIDPVDGVEKVCRTRVLQGSKGAVSVGGSIENPKQFYKGDVVYVGCKVLFPIGFDLNAVNNVPSFSRQKFMRLRNFDNAGNSIGYNDLYIIRDPYSAGAGCQFQFIKEGETPSASWRNLGDRTHDIILGEWISYQMAVHADNVSVDDGGKGKVEFFIDGELVDTVTSVKTMENPDDVLAEFLCFTYWDDLTASSDQTWYIDNPFTSNLNPDGQDSQGNARFNQ